MGELNSPDELLAALTNAVKRHVPETPEEEARRRKREAKQHLDAISNEHQIAIAKYSAIALNDDAALAARLGMPLAHDTNFWK